MKTKKLISASIITLSIFGFSILSTELSAKKFHFKYNSGKNKTKKMRLIKSFITNTGNVGKARDIGLSFNPGQKINFYYKVGPVKVIKGKGAPFKTRLVIKKGSRTLKDFGWHKSNAVSGKNLKRNATFGWFHTSKWYLNLSKTIKPGSYTAVITHKDQNSKSSVKIRYNFIIGGNKTINNSISNKKLLSPKDAADYFIAELKKKRIKNLKKFIASKTRYEYCSPRGKKKSNWSKQKVFKLFIKISKDMELLGPEYSLDNTIPTRIMSNQFYLGDVAGNSQFTLQFMIIKNKWKLIFINENNGCH